MILVHTRRRRERLSSQSFPSNTVQSAAARRCVCGFILQLGTILTHKKDLPRCHKDDVAVRKDSLRQLLTYIFTGMTSLILCD
jgi:hypothetical protein